MSKRSGLPKHVTTFLDRHGKRRVRGRRHGVTYYFKSAPGTDGFLMEYQKWLAGQTPHGEIGAKQTKPGSVSALIVLYYKSAEWVVLTAGTRAIYRGNIERFRAEHGDKPVRMLERKHVRKMLAEKAATPAAANNLLRMIRVLMRLAVDDGWRKDDPTLGVKSIRMRSTGFHTWTDEEIASFERHWPIGTRERLAMALLLFTAQRRSDVVRMGRQHIKGRAIQVTQAKTGVRLAIPVLPELQAVLDATPSDNLTFLTTSEGKPFNAKYFGEWFTAASRAAGLPKGCTAHGLRKAACRRLAEAGCSANQIASISGHKTLREVARYTAAADQERLAKAAMGALSGTKSERKMANRLKVSQKRMANH